MNKLNFLEKINNFRLKSILILSNFNKLNSLKKSIFINRKEKINSFFISLFFFVSNGKIFKKIYLLKFFLNLKFGELLLTRSKFSYLKKNKKAIKR